MNGKRSRNIPWALIVIGIYYAGLVYRLHIPTVLFTTPEMPVATTWILRYEIVGIVTSWFLTLLFAVLLRRETLTYLQFFFIGAAVYILQVALFMVKRGFTPELMIPAGVAMIVYIWWYFKNLKNRSSKKCPVCGNEAMFALTTATPSTGGKERRFCFIHFIEELNNGLRDYEGRFVIRSFDGGDEMKEAMYFFYSPQDLAVDGYSQTDIRAMEAVISRVFDGKSESDEKIVGLLPPSSIRVISMKNHDESRLIKDSVDVIASGVKYMTSDEMVSYLQSALGQFDVLKRKFKMNLPYAQTGIYFLHDYL